MLFKMKGQDWLSKVTKVFLMFCIIGLILLLAKGTLDNKTRCFPVVNESNDINASYTQYTYNKYCYDETPTTPDMVYKYTFWGFIIFAGGLIILGFWWLFGAFKRLAGLK